MLRPGKRGGELERGVGAHRHEAAGAERELPRVAGQQVEPEGGQRVDQERDQHRLQPVLAGDAAAARTNAAASGERRRAPDPGRSGKIAWSLAYVVLNCPASR